MARSVPIYRGCRCSEMFKMSENIFCIIHDFPLRIAVHMSLIVSTQDDSGHFFDFNFRDIDTCISLFTFFKEYSNFMYLKLYAKIFIISPRIDTKRNLSNSRCELFFIPVTIRIARV